MSTGDSPRPPYPGIGAEWAQERRKALGETYARLTGKPDIVSEAEMDGTLVRLVPWPHEVLEETLTKEGWVVVGYGAAYRRWQRGTPTGPMVIVPLNPDYADYAELIEHADVTRRNVDRVVAALPDYYPAGLVVTPKMADEMKRRGWREPAEIITTEEQLVDLPDGSIVLCSDGIARSYLTSILGPCLRNPRPDTGSVIGNLTRYLPAEVLWRPTEPEGDQ